MGPQHPSTHGVLRLVLELEGETVTESRVVIGYLHTGIEKNTEFRTWTQGVTFVTRMDYLSPFFNETAYCLGVEKLLGVTEQIPQRATHIRVLLMELQRISSHLVWLATGGMEIGALSAMLYGFREREVILDLFELITGLRMNHAFIRPGGVAQDLPPDAVAKIREFLEYMPKKLKEYEKLLTGQPIWQRRLQGVGYLDAAGCLALGVTGPILRSAGPAVGPAQDRAVLRLRDLRLRRARPRSTPTAGRRYVVRHGRDARVAEDHRAGARPAGAGPGHGRRQEDRVAGAARARPRRHGQLARPHPQDHGHLDGGADPPLQARHGGLPGAGRAGLLADRVAARRARLPHGQRRRHPAVPRPRARPIVRQPAGRAGDDRGRRWSPTSSPPSPRSTR